MVTVFIGPVGRRELIPFVQPLDEAEAQNRFISIPYVMLIDRDDLSKDACHLEAIPCGDPCRL